MKPAPLSAGQRQHGEPGKNIPGRHKNAAELTPELPQQRFVFDENGGGIDRTLCRHLGAAGMSRRGPTRSGILEAVKQQHCPLLTALLVTLTTAGLGLLAAGATAAIYANSPANRENNSFAGIGVAVGIAIAALGGRRTEPEHARA